MKKYSIFMAVAALMFAVSCNKEEVNTVEPAVETELITVDLNPMTKTSLSGKATVWTAGDAVSVTVGGKNIGTLTLVEGSTFSGEVEAGYNGEATLNYPSGVTTVPASQEAVANSFANRAALLEGKAQMDELRAGKGAQLSNTTALLQFSVAQAGDVTFEVGSTKYTVTGCETDKTYYACVAPASDVNFVARIGGYLSKQAPKNVTFTANKIANLNELPAPVASGYALIGSHNNWDFSKLTPVYKDVDNKLVVLNISGMGDFKLINKDASSWDNVSTNRGIGNEMYASGRTEITMYHNGSNIKVASNSIKYNITFNSVLDKVIIEESSLPGAVTKYSIVGSGDNWESDIMFLETATSNVIVAKNVFFKKDVGVKIRQDKNWSNNWSCDWKALKVNTLMDCRKGYDCNMLFADGSKDWDKQYDVYVKLSASTPSKFKIVTAGSSAPSF